MIKAIRVDYRLLHGQVSVAWTAQLGADCLLLVSDTVKNDKLRMDALRLAKPTGVKVVIKNTEEAKAALLSTVTDKYKLFIICENINIANEIINSTGEKSLNIGNTPFREGTKRYGQSAFLLPEEEKIIGDMLNKDVDVFIQMVPTEKSIKCKSLFK